MNNKLGTQLHALADSMQFTCTQTIEMCRAQMAVRDLADDCEQCPDNYAADESPVTDAYDAYIVARMENETNESKREWWRRLLGSVRKAATM